MASAEQAWQHALSQITIAHFAVSIDADGAGSATADDLKDADLARRTGEGVAADLAGGGVHHSGAG
jgi:hypothetical protein